MGHPWPNQHKAGVEFTYLAWGRAADLKSPARSLRQTEGSAMMANEPAARAPAFARNVRRVLGFLNIP